MALQRSTKDDNLTSMYNCLETGAFSDLTITCGYKTWNAHRVVVCPKSPFFRAACAGNFKEATTGVINPEDDDPLAVKFMMDYLYKDYYSISEEFPSGGSPITLNIHVRVYCLGDKYDIVGLRLMATSFYEDYVRECATFKEYLASIPDAYLSQVSNDFRKSVINYGKLKLSLDVWSDESRSRLKQVMKDIPEFGSDLIEAVITRPVSGICQDCMDHNVSPQMIDSCHFCGVILD